MHNLFEAATAADIISRLQRIEPGTPARWGKMNAAQMMAHCQEPFRVYFGELKLKRGFISYIFGRIAKKKLSADKPWPQNLPTAKEFVVSDDRNLEEERRKLISMINRFSREGYEVTEMEHPFFGKMSSQEWGLLGYKHTDHHLQQFGV